MIKSKEVWMPVVGYEDLYLISNYGTLKSISRFIINSPNGVSGFYTKERLIKGSYDTKGYVIYQLYGVGGRKVIKSHRLIAQTFISNPNNYPQVNHKNEIKDDNRVENLEWCTNLYNHHYGTAKQRIGNKTRNHSETSIPVLQLSFDGEIIREWESMQEAHRKGFQQSCISRCCKGTQRFHKGFKWRYAND